MADYEFTSTEKLAVIDGISYVGKPVTLDQADEILTIKGNASLSNRTWVSATFNIPADAVGKIPSTAFYELLQLAMEVNGLVKKEQTPSVAPAETPLTPDSSQPTS